MWQVACVRRGSEKRVSNFCKNNGIDHYCPRLIKSNPKNSLLVPNYEIGYCFDGFVFVKSDDLKSKLIETCSDVYHFLCWFGKRVMINSKDMDQIEKICKSNKFYIMEQLHHDQSNRKKLNLFFNGNHNHDKVISTGNETHIIESLRIKLTEIPFNEETKRIKSDKYNYEKYYYWL